MKDLKSLLNTELTWELHKGRAILRSKSKVILKLRDEKKSRSSFKFHGKEFTIRNEGFWNAKTIIERDDEQVLVMSRSFAGGSTSVELLDGTSYNWEVSHGPLLTLSFFITQHNVVLNYTLRPRRKQKIVLNVLNSDIPESDLLLLMVLGFFCFRGMMKENGATEKISIAQA